MKCVNYGFICYMKKKIKSGKKEQTLKTTTSKLILSKLTVSIDRLNYVATLTFREKKKTLLSEHFSKTRIAELSNRQRTHKTTHPSPYGYSSFINETHFYEFSEVKETNF